MDPTILVVEDDELLNETLTETLEDEGYSVVSATGGYQAMEVCSSHDLKLVITDVRLPDLDGVETLSGIRSFHPDVRCILTTGYAGPEIPAQAMRMKVDDYLVKPYSLDTLLTVVKRTVDRPELSGTKIFSAGMEFPDNLEDDEDLVDLLQARTEAFRAFLLGVKSSHLDEFLVNSVYQDLKSSEAELWKHLPSSVPSSEQYDQLRMSYIQVKTRLIHQKHEPDESISQRLQAELQKVVTAVTESLIGLEALHYLPYLEQLDKQEVKECAERSALFDKVWGQTNPV